MLRTGALGKTYEDGECIARQGETGRCMYIIQDGCVEVIVDGEQGEILLSTLGSGDVFGEMALFTGEPRSATVRARGKARVLTIDKRGFMQRVHEDPSLAFRILQRMSERVQELDEEVVRLRNRRG